MVTGIAIRIRDSLNGRELSGGVSVPVTSDLGLWTPDQPSAGGTNPGLPQVLAQQCETVCIRAAAWPWRCLLPNAAHHPAGSPGKPGNRSSNEGTKAGVCPAAD